MDALEFAVSHRDETIRADATAINAKPDDPRPAYAFDDTIKQRCRPSSSLAARQIELDAKRVGESRQHEGSDRSNKITDTEIRVEAMKRVTE